MKNYSNFSRRIVDMIRNASLIIFLMVSMLPISKGLAADYIIPLDSLHWQKDYHGNFYANGDSVIFYGTSYRVGNEIISSQFFDMTDAEIFLKWKVNGAGSFMAIWVQTSYFQPFTFFSTDHSYNGSVLVDSNVWYYVHMQSVNHGDSLLYTLTVNDYDINGGTIVFQTKVEAVKSKAMIKKVDRIFLRFGDNYSGENCYFVLGEAMVKNTQEYTANFTNNTNFDFENGVMPLEFVQNSGNYWAVDTVGKESAYGLFADVPPNDKAEIGFRVQAPCKMGFDQKFISNYDWNPDRSMYFLVDSVGIYGFDRSNFGDWFHYDIYLPDSNIHYIALIVGPSHYIDQNAQAYVDNITVSGGTVLGLKDEAQSMSSFQLMQNYPNPFNPATTIKYQLSQNGIVDISIFNILGQKLTTLVHKFQSAGSYQVSFDISQTGREWPSGIYLYSLQFKGENGKIFKQIKKMLLVK